MTEEDNGRPRENPPRSRKLISDNLKRVYREMLEEDVPDKFKDLLDRLEQSDTQDKGRK